MEGNYYKINENGKYELYFDYDEYQKLSTDEKKEIKRYFLWSRVKKAWVSKGKSSYSVKRFIDKYGFEFKGKDKALTFGEEIQRKKDKAERNIEKYERRGLSAVERAKNLQSEFNRLRKDWSWLTQPIITGHKGSESFGRSRDRVISKYKKGFEEYDKAKYYETKKKLAEDTLNDKQLKNVRYLDNRIKEAETSIRKISKWVEEYQEKLPTLTDDEMISKYESYIEDGLERLTYNYDKLAYYKLAKDNLKDDLAESGVILFDKEKSKELAKYIKKYFKDEKGLTTSVSTSSSYISISGRPKDGSREIPMDIVKSVAIFVYPDYKEAFEKGRTSIGNISKYYISLSPKQWNEYLKTQGFEFLGEDKKEEENKDENMNLTKEQKEQLQAVIDSTEVPTHIKEEAEMLLMMDSKYDESRITPEEYIQEYRNRYEKFYDYDTTDWFEENVLSTRIENSELSARMINKLIDSGLSKQIALDIFLGKDLSHVEGEVETTSDLHGLMPEYMEEWVNHILNNNAKNVFEAGFKYLELKKGAFDRLGLESIGEIKYKDKNYRGELTDYNKDAWVTKDCKTIFFKNGGYYGLYSTDLAEGKKLADNIIKETSYVKDVDFYYNGKTTIPVELALDTLDKCVKGKLGKDSVKREATAKKLPDGSYGIRMLDGKSYQGSVNDTFASYKLKSDAVEKIKRDSNLIYVETKGKGYVENIKPKKDPIIQDKLDILKLLLETAEGEEKELIQDKIEILELL